MYTNEIAKKLELRPNLVIHHLQKMQSIGLLEIINKKITQKGEERRFFKIPKSMLIIPNESKEIKKNGILKKIFKERIKFVAIGIISVFSGVFSSLSFNQRPYYDPHYPTPHIPEISLFPLVVTLSVIIIGLVVERIWKERKIKKVGDY
jgi:hypothetical protein